MREIVHIQAGQCGNQIGAKVRLNFLQPALGYFEKIDPACFCCRAGSNILDVKRLECIAHTVFIKKTEGSSVWGL